jgi:hypothetical protein
MYSTTYKQRIYLKRTTTLTTFEYFSWIKTKRKTKQKGKAKLNLQKNISKVREKENS